MITADRLRELVNYDPETGLFTWLKPCGRWDRIPSGSIAGTAHNAGYWQINLDGRLYLAHRLAVLYVTGSWPSNLIDHENLNRSDNRWTNLRHATHSQNHMNSKVYANNALGVKGVSLHRDGKFVAQIQRSGSSRHLGLFSTVAEAKAAYDKAATEDFGKFARLR